MEKLPPIPTPLGTQWREFRVQYMPIITFVAIVIIVVAMWRTYVLPPNVVAEVEPVRANVISVLPGTLVSLSVERFQQVTAGQEIGRVQVMETNQLNANLADVDADLQVLKARMSLDETRNLQAYERERLSLAQERVQLEIDKVLAKQWDAEFIRVSNLFHTKVSPISVSEYDVARYTAEKYRVSVAETEKYLVEKEKSLPLIKSKALGYENLIQQASTVQSNSVSAEYQTIILKAPMSGTICVISNLVGEQVMAGRPIVVISANRSERIVGYVRQPLNMVPKSNDVVQIRRQNFRREVGFGKIVQVGTQLEPINPVLTASIGATTGKNVEMGLPFLIKLDERSTLSLTPGERVDVIMNPKLAAN